MRKLGMAMAIGFAVFIALAFIARFTGVVQYYKVSTGVNEPTYKIGDHFLITRLGAPSLTDFVCFRALNSQTGETEIWFQRLCGEGGDTVEIRNGICYVNGIDIDQHLVLQHRYKLGNKTADLLNIDPTLGGEMQHDSVVFFS